MSFPKLLVALDDPELSKTVFAQAVALAQWGAALIMVGRRGQKGLPEALLGRVNNDAVHHAHGSVLMMQGETEPQV